MRNKELANARRKMNLTQSQVADKLGIRASSYQRFESGLRIPRVGMAIQLAHILNSSVEHLFQFSTSEMDKKES
ncbi:helix-turn-helix domain-containing protein [Limosilactobacillus agrestis]|uniref:Helix-turn-helix domain-containing protein n=2 Tax=Limosilactobacillus agrestis TaxID=2759748 RepID=A0ABS8R583_9LACO|nr:helix-turn-helix transcriptional regulator [Limosilactobacillus agrestis]MCD7129866.1 helix-turn-helix domain-containing protein [Limosilactobacillus agrestis]